MKPTSPLVVRSGLVVLAAVAAVAPMPPARVETWYSRGMYLSMQRVLTAASNLTAIAVLDVLIAMAIVAAAVWLFLRVRRRGSSGWGRTLMRLGADTLVAAACVYLVFLAAWGLNYRRQSLRVTVDFDEARVTHEAVVALLNRTVDELNALRGPAHAGAWPPLAATSATLAPAFDEAQRGLGLPRVAVAGRPKASLLSWYFPRAAIDGMTNPFALEVIVNPEVLPFERPAVLAHEWAHLAGFADESEASFVGWVACQRAGEQARYSAWLSLALHLASAVTTEEYRAAIDHLDRGARDDLRAIVARVRRAVPVVRTAARRVYDGYLKANRVASGVRSYDEVVVLIAGTRFDEGFRPVVRRAVP
jgi:hypothetical protein